MYDLYFSHLATLIKLYYNSVYMYIALYMYMSHTHVVHVHV